MSYDDDLLGPSEGDNSKPAKATKAVKAGGAAAKQLKSFIERIERLEEEKRSTGEDIREVMTEAKGNGFDPKVIRAILKERKADPAALDEFEAALDLYRHALGMA